MSRPTRWLACDGEPRPPPAACRVLALEHLFQDRSGEGGTDLSPLQLGDLAAARRRPFDKPHNVALASVDEAETELSPLASAALARGEELLVCETTPPSRGPQRARQLADLSARFGADAPLSVIAGTGWAPGDATSGLADRLAADLAERGGGGSESGSIRAGLIGELVLCGGLDASEQAVLRAACAAQARVAAANDSRGPPVLVSLAERGPGDEVAWNEVFAAAQAALEVWADAGRGLEGPRNVLLLNGLLERLPGLERGLEELEEAVRALRGILEACEDVALVVGNPAAERRQLVAFAVAQLAKAGLDDRVWLSSCVAFKTDLVRYGGAGYAGVYEELEPRLEAAGVSAAALARMRGGNALAALAWHRAPAPVKAKKRPRWACDGPCGKTYPAKKEPFTRLGYSYCSVACMRQHKAELDAAAGGGDADDAGSGGRGARRAGGGASWGITVGT